jgi:hypothetical protein
MTEPRLVGLIVLFGSVSLLATAGLLWVVLA